MELLLIVIVVGAIGYLIGRSRRRKASLPASEQIIDADAKDPGVSV